VWKDRNMDERFNTADDSSTSDKTLVNFGPVTPKFYRRVCAGRATRWVFAKSLISAGEAARRAGSRWTLPRI